MHLNLVMATGLACSIGGALLMTVSHCAIRRAASRIAAAYPRDLARRRVRRHDRRFGFGMLALGGLFHALAALGYSAPFSLWRYPVCAALACLLVYGAWRFAALRWRVTPRGRATSQSSVRSFYDTRRTTRLREAAQLEAAGIHARELARHPRDRGVVYLAREWDRRWWSDRFGVSASILQAVVREVGPMSKDIERHLALVVSPDSVRHPVSV
jgi:hypothetical protein